MDLKIVDVSKYKIKNVLCQKKTVKKLRQDNEIEVRKMRGPFFEEMLFELRFP